MYKIELTEEEKQALFNLLHIAIKNVGLEGNFANTALFLINKINAGKVEVKE